jgi:hypothetical protein
MTFFGLTDPYVIGAYICSILCVIGCCVWAILKKEKSDGEEEEDES